MISQAWALGVVVAGLELILVLALAVLASVSGVYLLDRLTRGMDEWKEIKRGNVAVGITLLGIILAIAIVDEQTMGQTLDALQPGVAAGTLLALFVAGVINLLLATLLAIATVYIAIRLFDSITVDIDELGELKKGNQAMALVLAGIILAIAFLAKGAIGQVVDAVGIIPWVLGWAG